MHKGDTFGVVDIVGSLQTLAAKLKDSDESGEEGEIEDK